MTTEPMSDFELRLSRALHTYADATLAAPAARRWTVRPMLLVAAAVLLLAVGVGSAYLLGSAASRPGEARVAGQTYGISIARSLDLDADDVTAFGTVESSEMYLFADPTAFAIAGVDPDVALVVRTAPGQGDDAGPYGAWILLIRGDLQPLCPYFDPASDSTPDICRAGTP